MVRIGRSSDPVALGSVTMVMLHSETSEEKLPGGMTSWPRWDSEGIVPAKEKQQTNAALQI